MTAAVTARRLCADAGAPIEAEAVVILVPPKRRGKHSTRSDPDHLAGVHDVLRVEGTLQLAHGVELDLAALVLELLDLDAADAVLGGDRAAISHDQIVD